MAYQYIPCCSISSQAARNDSTSVVHVQGQVIAICRNGRKGPSKKATREGLTVHVTQHDERVCTMAYPKDWLNNQKISKGLAGSGILYSLSLHDINIHLQYHLGHVVG